jgi:hypothetical protein
MRRVLGFLLFATTFSAALSLVARAQAPVSPDEAATCFGFSFGPWTPPLDWRASGHERTLESISVPHAADGRGWAAELTHPDQDGTMLIFPSWWPVGVKVALPTRALTPGDTIDGRATALVGNGFVSPSRAAVRAWLVRCGNTRGESSTLATAARIGDRLPIGTWRGTSTCLTRQERCSSDSVVYRIAAIDSASDSAADSVSLAASIIGARGERPASQLRCRYDNLSKILACNAPEGVLRLAVRGIELGGRLTRSDGVDLRYVYVRRAGRR